MVIRTRRFKAGLFWTHQSLNRRTPPNCTFEVDDFEDDWVYKAPFDFIHARELEGCIADDARLFRQMFQNLVSGGYVELQAVDSIFACDDGTIAKAPKAQFWVQTLRESSARFGKPVNGAPTWKKKLEKTGFVDVQERILKVSISAGYDSYWNSEDI